MKSTLAFLFLVFLFFENTVDKDYLLGKFEPSTDSRFVQLTTTYAKGNAVNQFLRRETFKAFQKMKKAARRDTVNLFIVSATRNFDYQKKIWEDKWNGKVKVEDKDLSLIADLNERAEFILRYSSMPATSRHHWGTDIDINSTEVEYFSTEEGCKTYQWLLVHASEFDFCQPYTSKENGRTGYEEEMWHWSYLPLSKVFIEEYKKQIQYSDINGFLGSETAQSIQVIEKYVDGVACR